MDPWLVAAAAGAGCLAKYWQSLSRDREGLSGFASRSKIAAKTGSSSLIGQILDNTFSFQMERKPQQQILTEIENENLSDGRFVETTQLYKHLSEEVSSTSAAEDEQQEFVRKHQQYKLLSSSILQPVVPKYENNQEYGDGIRWDGHVGGTIGETLEQSTWEMDTLSGFGKGRSSLRSRCNHLQSLKPLNSLEICLMAQLYKEHAEMEYVLGPNPSSKPTLRPFYVSDGSQIISKASLDSYCVQIGDERDKLQKEVHPEANEKAVEIPHISKIWSAKGLKKQHLGKGKDLIGKLSSSEQLINEMQFQTQGSLSGVVLFCLGISIGVVSNILANKMEMEKLKELLKQTENLVQDLQEELEMKDSLTLKELVNENDSSLDAHDSSINNRRTLAHSTQSNSNEAVKYSGGESEDQKTDEKLESMYKLEAELEAELERLELNMKESSLHGLLDVVKVFVTDLWSDHTPWPFNQLPKSYNFLVKHGPLWKMTYYGSAPRVVHQSNFAATSTFIAREVAKGLMKYQPDIIISVHPLMQHVPLRILRAKGLLQKIVFTTIVTDLSTCHPTWFHKLVTRCYCPSNDVARRAMKAGLQSSQIRVYGLPVRPSFVKPVKPKDELRKELGMDEHLPAVLLMGGGEGMGPIEATARALGEALYDENLGVPMGQVLVICGRNKKLANKLNAIDWKVPVQVKGFVTKMEVCMGACDCIITKAGPGTIAEAMIRGLPIILNDYIAGQEAGNVPYVVGNGFGKFSKSPKEIANIVAQWFGPKVDELQAMSQNALKLARPDAVFKIVHDLHELVRQRNCVPQYSLCP